MQIPDAKAAVVKEWEKLEKIPAWQLTKVRNKKRGDHWSKEWGQNSTVFVVPGHLSPREFGVGTKNFRNTKVESFSEVTLWRMIQDLKQYLRNKDHQLHKMTAAKVMDVIATLPGCAGQAADAVSAHTPVKMEDVPKLLKIPKSECPDIWIRLPRHKWPESLSSVEDPVVPLERNLYGHPLAGLLRERQFEKKSICTRLGNSSNLWMFIR